MRYSASEKFEIIELVEQSSLSIRRTLAPIGIPRSTFYDWYSRYREGGIEALVDGKPRPRRIWNKIPDKIETAIVNLAFEEPDLSPRELAVRQRLQKWPQMPAFGGRAGLSRRPAVVGAFVGTMRKCRKHQ